MCYIHARYGQYGSCFFLLLITDLAKQHLVVSFVTSDSVSGKVRSRSSEEPRDRQAQAVALFFIFMYSHSAVFKFGGLLRLLDINLIKQDKPIS